MRNTRKLVKERFQELKERLTEKPSVELRGEERREMRRHGGEQTSRKVVIVMSKCVHSKAAYGIRMETFRLGNWTATWAFAIKEAAAKREGYDRNEMAGSFDFSDTYPGCPTCHAPGIFLCSCGRVGCWDGKNEVVTCPHCDKKVKLAGEIERLTGGSDL